MKPIFIIIILVSLWIIAEIIQKIRRGRVS